MAILAFILVMVGLVPLQLGSPAAPYMDVMSYPASVQRILSFKRYLPFDNDPYGCWGPQAQTPGAGIVSRDARDGLAGEAGSARA